MHMSASPVKQLAMKHDLPILQPLTLKSVEIQQQLAQMNADIMVVAAYGLILPLVVLETPQYGCLNIHASLLPRWRGAAPIQRAIQAGDKETGVTIMQMDAGLDTGAMLLKKTCLISDNDTAQSLHDKLAMLGAQLIVETLQALQKGKLHGEIQDNSQANYASKISKAEAQIDWSLSAAQLERSIRAYNPTPVANTTLNGITIKIWQASIAKTGQGEAGTVLALTEQGIEVACGTGALCLEVLQKPNSKAMPYKQFLQAFPVKVGDRFSTYP